MRTSKRLMTGLGLLVVFSMMTTDGFASGGGGGAIAPPRPGASDAFAMTKTVKGSFIKFDGEKNTLIVKDAKNRELTLMVSKKTRFRAEDPQDYAGRKDLKPEEFTPNTAVKVIYQEIDKTVVEIKAIKKS